ncbi:Pyrophosphate--fructose 6-phosphate 1-phosphotransferase OS=Streptomyces violarus OX=67380 GN=pfp PE=3 SV=1 [Streptomyces violarus]
MRVGVLTGGGDCPGLNAVIRAIVRKGVQEYGYDFVGFRDGWRGPLEGATVRLDIPAVRGILPRGGTDPRLLATIARRRTASRASRRTSPDWTSARSSRSAARTPSASPGRLSDEYGAPCVGVPKTIDNDLSATDYTFGFDTAVCIATEAIDRLHTTAESHMRVLVWR